MANHSRRAFLATAAASLGTLAGCVDALTGGDDDAREAALESASDDTATPAREGPVAPPEWEDGETTTEDVDADLPVQEPTVSVPYELGALEEDAESGGVPKDGIPSIDDPVFDDADHGDENLDPGDPVFGVEIDGVAKAYPQYILVFHEIVNDTVAGEDLAVTYCPLTGTALAYERDGVEFGVSGMLINSNLIMYDRETDSWWPQMHPVSPLGELQGWALRERRVTWTTWERWKETYPDTEVLTEDTDAVRNYGSDPYGAYNPRSGYYDGSNTMFPPRFENDEYHPKAVFIGARSREGEIAFRKETLRAERLLEATLDGTSYLAAYHDGLDSAWVYRNPDGEVFDAVVEGYEGPEGGVYEADELPLQPINAYDTFWFPWYGYYPETEVVA